MRVGTLAELLGYVDKTNEAWVDAQSQGGLIFLGSTDYGMELITAISATETMMDGDLRRYLEVGRSAMAAIDKVAPHINPASILDLPSGHGRVARHLRHRYPEADLSVADLDEQGADFCSKHFNARLLDSKKNFDDIEFNESFDLIWVGSLVTHLAEDDTLRFLRFLRRHLSSKGIACVSSHGALVAGRVMQASWSGESVYGCSQPDEAAMLKSYFENGYGYAPYSHSADYGISIASREWWGHSADKESLILNNYSEHAWDNHQDVLSLSVK